VRVRLSYNPHHGLEIYHEPVLTEEITPTLPIDLSPIGICDEHETYAEAVTCMHSSKALQLASAVYLRLAFAGRKIYQLPVVREYNTTEFSVKSTRDLTVLCYRCCIRHTTMSTGGYKDDSVDVTEI